MLNGCFNRRDFNGEVLLKAESLSTDIFSEFKISGGGEEGCDD
jgi:hypothetical protein